MPRQQHRAQPGSFTAPCQNSQLHAGLRVISIIPSRVKTPAVMPALTPAPAPAVAFTQKTTLIQWSTDVT